MTAAMWWLFAGGAAGWITCSVLDLDARRGLTVSAIIGLVGALFGGEALAPVYGAGGVNETALRGPFAVLVVCVGAIACLKLASIAYRAFRPRSPTAFELPTER